MDKKNLLKATYSAIMVICAIIGAMWVAVQIKERLFPSDYKLEAYGDAVALQNPPLTKEAAERLQKLSNGLPNDKLKAIEPKLNESQVLELERLWLEHKRELQPADIFSDFKNLQSIWWFTVRNVGSREVTNIQLELPFDGRYTITANGQTSDVAAFKRNVEIGSLRPLQGVNITVWTTSLAVASTSRGVDDAYFNYIYDAENTRVTHPNGAIDISYPQRTRSTLAYFVTTPTFQGVSITLLLFMFVLVVLLLAAFLKKPKEIATTNRNSDGSQVEESASADDT